jgi:DNA-binding winged helix-turn-helix (wHTH) protein
MGWLLFTATTVNKADEYAEKHLIIVLRDVGHQLLLHAKDSTSRVLPIRKIDANTFQIAFQSQFTFVPDTLVNLVYNRLKSANSPTEYIVNVIDCNNKALIFAYEVSAKTENIMPCLGRKQPVGCYIVQIEFLKTKTFNFSNYIFLLLIPLGIIGYLLSGKYLINKNVENEPKILDYIPIGAYAFYSEKKTLKYDEDLIELSDREAKLLKIFAQHQNQLIGREQLLKEVWEDEGIIVISRSLDVFVSKLRKKLQKDENIKITNLHGKGYKLEILSSL